MRWIISLSILLGIEVYALQAFRRLFSKKPVTILYIVLSALIYGMMIGSFFTTVQGGTFGQPRAFFIGLFLSMMALKIGLLVFMFTEDIGRVIRYVVRLIFPSSKKSFPSRRKFISQLALGISAIPFFSLLYGMYQGKYNFKVLKYKLEFEDLPKAFKGLKVLQISDIHSGSLDNKEKIQYGVDLINSQQADIICFTGDLVNNLAKEMDNWFEVFNQIEAKIGIYSILGNHDYGDYHDWDSQEDKTENFNQLLNIHQKLGWKMLRNEHISLERSGEKLHIVGVENWGNGGFVKYGDIDKASQNLTAEDFKILMNHDPSYWDEKVKDHPKNFQLCLSGHTHGMQFGIEIPGWFKWSPVQYRYKQWAGIYKHHNRLINVNRGFGYLAYPGRVGIWPEVTVIELG
ncbi:MAG: metallophosphoesterase [Psychroflexus sp.]|nr:metallophosphoesterase [Psychroflexus sp.]